MANFWWFISNIQNSNFFDFVIYQKFKGWTLIKCLISSFSNLSETLHSQRKFRNKQIAKIWSLYLKNQKFGTTMQSPEGLEDSPLRWDLYLTSLTLWLRPCRITKQQFLVSPSSHPFDCKVLFGILNPQSEADEGSKLRLL